MTNRALPRGILWDMDGVLVDTGELHFQSWLETLQAAGIPFDREVFRATFGMNNAGILAFLLGHPPEPAQLAAISDRKEERFRQSVRGRVQALPGVRQALAWFGAHGFRQAVASSAPQANLEAVIGELGIGPYLDAQVSAFDLPGKPDPAVFLEAARRIGAPPEACVVIEDAIVGVQAAKRAGMKCIAVLTTNPREALGDADLVVANLGGHHWERVVAWLNG